MLYKRISFSTKGLKILGFLNELCANLCLFNRSDLCTVQCSGSNFSVFEKKMLKIIHVLVIFVPMCCCFNYGKLSIFLFNWITACLILF